jgi:predicted alpha/beta-hydrolase family hydrolase
MRGSLISRRGAVATAVAMAVSGPALAVGSAANITAEDGRSVKVSIWPAVGEQSGVILFSHGALSSPESYERLIGPWTRAGFKVLAPLHVDSTRHPDHARHGMIDSWRCRLLDMRALGGFANSPRYIAAGHSYGALTALTLGGAQAVIPPGVAGPLRDPRAKAVVAFSPPGPSPGLITAEGYSHLAVPALIETGDRDVPPAAMGGGDYHMHLTAFDVAPAGDKYALVLEGVDHYFGGLICRLDLPGLPQTQGLGEAAVLSSDFLRAYGAGDASARARLETALTSHVGFDLRRK